MKKMILRTFVATTMVLPLYIWAHTTNKHANAASIYRSSAGCMTCHQGSGMEVENDDLNAQDNLPSEK